MMRRNILTAILVSSALVGCQEDGGEPQDVDPGPSQDRESEAPRADANNATTPGMTTPSGTTPSGTTPPDPDPNAPESCQSPDPTPLRRLSHFEYWNTLQALYPQVTFEHVALPQDNRPHEFDNDADALVVNAALVERYMEVSRAVTQALESAGALRESVACAAVAPTDRAEVASCGREFVRSQGGRLFRRPLSAQEVETYATLFDDEELAAASFAQLQRFTMHLLLSAPEFLYRFERPAGMALSPGESVPLGPYALASRLSYFLWGSGPDAELMELAADGSLMEPEVLKAQAERMLEDEQALGVFMHFHEQWLDLERLKGLTKAPEENFEDVMSDALHEQGMMFIGEVLHGGSVADIWTSRRVFIDARTAPLFGEEVSGDEWREISPPDRSGWLTQPAFLASHGHPDKPSPVLRGAFVIKRVLCESIGSPPPGAEAAAGDTEESLAESLTNRETYELTTNSQAPCTACHMRMNPPGYALEAYDTMGRWQDIDPSGFPIETGSSFGEFAFADAAEMNAQFANHPKVEACVTKKWLRYAWSGGPLESSECLVNDILDSARDESGELQIRDIQLAVVTHPWFALYTAPEPEEAE